MIPNRFFFRIRLVKWNRRRKEAPVEEIDVLSDAYIDGKRAAEAVRKVRMEAATVIAIEERKQRFFCLAGVVEVLRQQTEMT